jgi:hypothetical protein
MADEAAAEQQEQPGETPPEAVATAEWALPQWVGFSRGVWTALASKLGASEITLEPLPGVPGGAIHGECGDAPPYAIWLRFRHAMPVAPGQVQLRLFDELMAAPTVEALIEVCQERVQEFLNQTGEKARSAIIHPSAVRAGNGKQLGPGLPKKLRQWGA